jgi:hypothetical protein
MNLDTFLPLSFTKHDSILLNLNDLNFTLGLLNPILVDLENCQSSTTAVNIADVCINKALQIKSKALQIKSKASPVLGSSIEDDVLLNDLDGYINSKPVIRSKHSTIQNTSISILNSCDAMINLLNDIDNQSSIASIVEIAQLSQNISNTIAAAHNALITARLQDQTLTNDLR